VIEVFTIQREDGWKIYVVIGLAVKEAQTTFDIFQIYTVSPNEDYDINI
jgi:hypothetical protein